MRRAAIAIAAITALVAWQAPAQARDAAKARRPIVVELYTSQGCSSCVAADKLLDQLAERPNVLALTLAVDYWDYLGWNDTFARPEFSARQRAYMKRLALRDLYTPQVIVDGAAQAPGADSAKVEALIKDAQRGKDPAPKMRLLRHGRLQVGAGRAPKGGAEVWLVRYDPGLQEVTVKRGENRGQTLAEKNVVRSLVRLGPWTGKSRTYAVPPADGAGKLKTAFLLQTARGGRILAVLAK
jgi:hypothetical protein